MISKCLEKDRDLRCQSAAELRADLKRIKRGSSSSSERIGRTTAEVTPELAQPPISSASRSGASVGGSAQQPSKAAVLAEAKRHKWRLILSPVIIALVILAYALYKHFTATESTINPLNMQITKLTENGVALSGAISPDGRYAAFVKLGKQQSLWVKQIATGSEAQVVPPTSGYFVASPAFSPRRQLHLLPAQCPQNEDEIDLFSFPSLGGTQQRILSDVNSAVSFSPNGKQIVFGHYDVGGKTQLAIASSDGTGRHMIAEREALAINSTSPAWSADGKLIAVPQFQLGKEGLNNLLIFTPQGELVKTFSFPFLVDGGRVVTRFQRDLHAGAFAGKKLQ